MFLSEILYGIKTKNEYEDKNITGICCDSRKIEEGNLFICIKGIKSDSHDMLTDEIENKAGAIIVSRDVGRKKQILVDDTREALALAAANFYHNRKNDLKLVAVTGTNGKTTITTLIKQVLEAAGKRVGLIGTVEYQMGDYSLPARYTTPDPLELHELFEKMYRMGIEYVIMEASSQALWQKRLFGVEFETAVFTNLTRDHLDYHGTMENYYLAKRMLFSQAKSAVVDIDDEYGIRLFNELKEQGCSVKTVSIDKDDADYVSKNIKIKAGSVEFETVSRGSICRMSMNSPGMFSVSNGLCTAAALAELGVSVEFTAEALKNSSGVKGRGEIIPTGTDFTVMRDYAHTPDSLEKIFSSVKEYATGRIIALFGAAGMRDSAKRGMMGEAAAKYADFIVITSDNPRAEDAETIAGQVEKGVINSGKPYKVIVDRYDAIHYVIKNAKPGDMIVLAGKGHEDYQILDGVSIYFDEREIVKKAIKKYFGV